MTKLEDIIQECLFTAGEVTQHKKMLYKKFGIDCVRKLNMDTIQQIVTKKIDMQPNKVVMLPSGCVDIVKIGIQVGDKIRTLVQNDKIARLFGEECCVPEPNTSVTNLYDNDFSNRGYIWTFQNFQNEYGEFLGTVYGYGTGLAYEAFTHDKANNRLVFDSLMRVQPVYVECVSTGFDVNGETFVPTTARDTIEAYIKWKVEVSKPRPDKGLAEMFRREYYNELRHTTARIDRLSTDDIVQIINNHLVLSPDK